MKEGFGLWFHSVGDSLSVLAFSLVFHGLCEGKRVVFFGGFGDSLSVLLSLSLVFHGLYEGKKEALAQVNERGLCLRVYWGR